MKASQATRPQLATIDGQQCRGIQAAAELPGRRWSTATQLAVACDTERFGDILRWVGGLSDRLLSQRLKELRSTCAPCSATA